MEEPDEKKAKLYKLYLDPNYSSRDVAEQTHNSWYKRSECWEPLRQEIVISGVNSSRIENLEEEDPSQSSNEETMDTVLEDESSLLEDKSTFLKDESIFLENRFELLEENSTFSEDESTLFDPERNVDGSEDKYIEDSHEVKTNDSGSKTLLVRNRIMFPISNITIEDVLEMIMGFSTRYPTSLEGRLKLFDMFKICAGPEFDNVNVSNYMMSKVFDPPQKVIKIHYYCINCEELLLVTQRHDFLKENKKQVICDKCSQQFELSLNSPNCFQVIDLKYQIQQLLKNPNIVKQFVNKIETRNADTMKISESIADVDDSTLYRDVVQKYPNAITYTFSTDGATAKNPLKCKTGFWPIQLLFNELPISMRFKFIPLISVMILKQEPSAKLLNLFLQSFVDQALELSKTDISVVVDGKTYLLKFILLFSPVDSVARALIQNRIKYNGYFGCTYCYINGVYAHGAVRYPFEEIDSILRSSKSHNDDLKVALTSKSTIRSRGVKGPSVLCSLADFDMVWSFCFDYLHTALFGAVEDISYSPYFSQSIIKKIDERLLAISPSHEVYKLPEKLSNKTAWKGTHLRSWLLFYSLPMCIDLLSSDVLVNLALFVKSMYRLLKMGTTEEELKECEIDIKRFLQTYQNLYGLRSMKYNIHMLKHAPNCYRKSGPLALTSTFIFESNMGFLKNLVVGTKNIGFEMAKKSMNFLAYKCQTRDYSCKPVVKAFCESLFSEKGYCLSARIRNEVTFFGKPNVSNDTETKGAETYTKCIYRSQTYHSVNYKRGSKFNDTMIQLKCGTIAQILEIMSMPEGQCYFLVWKLGSKQMVVQNVEIPHIWEITGIVEKAYMPLEYVSSKIICLQFEDKTFACRPPNVIESS